MEKSSVFMVLTLFLSLYSMVDGMDPAQTKESLRLSKRALKQMMKSFNACNEKLKFHEVSGEEFQKKIGCVVKCVMQTANVLDENDIMTEASLKKSVESQVPPEFQQIAHDKLLACVKEHKLDPKDENCKSYLDMGTCMQGTMVDMCGEPPLM